MDKFFEALQRNIETANDIGIKIEQKKSYMEEMQAYLPSLSQMITEIIKLQQNPEIVLDLNPDFVIQVMQDIVYGIENKDSVFLLDVLRYGLIEIYHYIMTELQSEEQNEQANL